MSGSLVDNRHPAVTGGGGSITSVNGQTGPVVTITAAGLGAEPAITASTSLKYYRGDKTFQTLDTSVVPENGNLFWTQGRFDTAFAAKSTTNLAEGAKLFYTDARVLAAPLTGFVSGAGTVAATDTVLQAIQKIDGNVVANTTTLNGKEASLGNPGTNGFILSSTAAGVRSWVAGVLGTALAGLSTATSAVVTASDTVLSAIGSLQGQISNITNIFTFAKNSSAPNATNPVMSIMATDSATDVDIAIVPKGFGNFALQIADGTTTAGNKRGNNSVDLQQTRTAATQVANGSNAFAAGARNTASAANTFASGLSCQATNTVATAMGNGNVASGANSFAVGTGTVASGNAATSIGNNTNASGLNCFVHGLQASAFSLTARHVFSSGWHSVAGDSQWSRWVLKAATVDATATVATIDGAAATAANRVALQLNNVYYFKGQILGKQTAASTATAVGCWTFSGMVMTGTTAASIILVGTPTITSVSNTGTWGTPTITVDTTNGALIFTVTGKAATTIRWNVCLDTQEIIYA